ncbi:hypothetical protein L209DRAFT_158917 [Thermothelomyces heterothallicus CBS 203.75]
MQIFTSRSIVAVPSHQPASLVPALISCYNSAPKRFGSARQAAEPRQGTPKGPRASSQDIKQEL